MLPTEKGPDNLSEREREILRLVATGASNKEMAQQLAITINTVKVHLHNIFTKIGAASRTEAALYAVRNGLVTVEGRPTPQAERLLTTGNHVSVVEARAYGEPSRAGFQNPTPPLEESAVVHRGESAQSRIAWIAVTATLLLGLSGLIIIWRQPRTVSTPNLPTPAPVSQQIKADLLIARSGMAVATYENRIYAIGGQTTQSVTGVVERYDPGSDTWAMLTSKPTAVADVGAAVIGGRVYVPGGRTDSGAVANLLESYDPRQDQWTRHASLPEAVSAYALIAFEGRLYLFGGWDGQKYVASVYEYDPRRDQWTERTPMPTARGFAGAAVAGGKIYVIGGTSGDQALSINEEYASENDVEDGHPWKTRASLPTGRAAMGVASAADIIYVFGGEDEGDRPLLEYFPTTDEWHSLDVLSIQPWSRLGVALVGTNLHVLGGIQDNQPQPLHVAYSVLYTILIPAINK
jgi:DNA-binding CsgD family transcriptional regulator/N-acetylneuraminic acid mutarotase